MTARLGDRVATLAARSLLREAEAGPKPGLVDRFAPGAHADMDIDRFRSSATALGPYFGRMAAIGATADGEGRARALRAEGLAAESAMLAATGGVNTHRGAIWALGLLSAAAGSLAGEEADARLIGEAVCSEAATMARDILGLPPPARSVPESKGLAARRVYGLRSARDEAIAGFPSIVEGALPVARALSCESRIAEAALGGSDEDSFVLTVLIAVMERLDDTCLAARGGLPALKDAKRAAAAIMAAGGPASRLGSELYAAMRADFEGRRLSPGGAADLCAATLFLLELEGPKNRR